ncbi:MAG: hypothetical protein RSF88_12210 [Lachnospiraceae bacterium]
MSIRIYLLWKKQSGITPLSLLRCVQLGISIRDLELLTIGMVNDMYAESGNDDCKYTTLAGQEDFEKFP